MPESSKKSEYVREMFSRIAPFYDRMNKIMTLGQDSRWRKRVVQLLQPADGNLYLDSGAGTGDLSDLILKAAPKARVAAADLTWEMISHGKKTRKDDGILWLIADAQLLPFASGTFNGTVSGYLFRNVPDIDRALVEQIRVLGGNSRLISLDTTPPVRNFLLPFILFYLRWVIPFFGRLLSGDNQAYNYLPESTRKHISGDDMALKMSMAGLESVKFEKWMAGTMAIHFGQKSE